MEQLIRPQYMELPVSYPRVHQVHRGISQKFFRIRTRGNMNLKGKIVSLIYALVLLGCAFFAGFDTFGFAFAIGDGGGQVSLAAGTLLIGTLAGGVGLVIAALGSWTRSQGISLVALVSVFLVLPAQCFMAGRMSTPPGSIHNLECIMACGPGHRPFCHRSSVWRRRGTQAPLNLERNVSLEAVRAFKLIALNEVKVIGSDLKRLLGLSSRQATDTVATATSMAGALWQMATQVPRCRPCIAASLSLRMRSSMLSQH
jgi:hypothetical protein